MLTLPADLAEPEGTALMYALERSLPGNPVVVKLAFEPDTAIAGPIRDAVEQDNLPEAQDAVWDYEKLEAKREYLGHIASLSAYYRFHAVKDPTYKPDEWASSSEPPSPGDPDFLTNILCVSHLNIPIGGERMFGIPAKLAKLFGMNMLRHEVEVIGDQIAAGTVYADSSPKQVLKREFYLPGDPRFVLAHKAAQLLLAHTGQLSGYQIPGVQPPEQVTKNLDLDIAPRTPEPRLIVPTQIRDLLPPALRAA